MLDSLIEFQTSGEVSSLFTHWKVCNEKNTIDHGDDVARRRCESRDRVAFIKYPKYVGHIPPVIKHEKPFRKSQVSEHWVRYGNHIDV